MNGLKNFVVAAVLGLPLLAGAETWEGPLHDVDNPGSGEWGFLGYWGGSIPSGVEAAIQGSSGSFSIDQNIDMQATAPGWIRVSGAPAGSGVATVFGDPVTAVSGSQTQLVKSVGGNFRLDSDLVAHQSLENGTSAGRVNVTHNPNADGTLAFGNIDARTVAVSNGADVIVATQGAHDGINALTTVAGSVYSSGKGRLQLSSNSYRPGSTATIALSGNAYAPASDGQQNLLSFRADGGNGGMGAVVVDGNVNAGSNDLVDLYGVGTNGGSGKMILGSSGEIGSANTLRLYAYQDTLANGGGTGLVQLDGRLRGTIPNIYAYTHSSGSYDSGRIEINNANNDVAAGRLTITGKVYLDDAFGGSTSNNLPNVERIDVSGQGHLDASGLRGGGFELGAGGVNQTLRVYSSPYNPATSGTYDGGLGIRTGSRAEFVHGFTLDAGETLMNNGTFQAGGPGLVVNGGMIGGTGVFQFNNSLTLGAGVVLAPGSSVGTTSFGAAQAWSDGLTLQLEVSDAGADPVGGIGANPGWDLWDVNANLSIAGVTAGGITIDLTSVLSADGDTPGAADNFDPTQDYSWEFVQYNSLSGTFSAGLFNVDATNFQHLATGVFSVGNTGNAFQLLYAGVGGGGAVPEPGTWAMFGLLGLVGLAYGRRRRQA